MARPCTECKKTLSDDESFLQCIVCHRYTHPQPGCIVGALGKSDQFLTYIRRAINKGNHNKKYETSFFHVCRFCYDSAFEHQGLANYILRNDKAVKNALTQYSKLSEALKKENTLIKTNHDLMAESVTTAKEQNDILQRELDRERKQRIEENVLYNNTIDRGNEELDKRATVIETLKLEIQTLQQTLDALRNDGDPANANTKKRKRDAMETDTSFTDLQDINMRIADTQKNQADILTALADLKAQILEINKAQPATIDSTPAQNTNSPPVLPPIEKTYARILKDSLDNSKRIRHVNGKGDDFNLRIENLAKFRATTDMTNLKYESLKEKGRTSFTITLLTEEDAISKEVS